MFSALNLVFASLVRDCAQKSITFSLLVMEKLVYYQAALNQMFKHQLFV